jgi:hypothetical protein
MPTLSITVLDTLKMSSIRNDRFHVFLDIEYHCTICNVQILEKALGTAFLTTKKEQCEKECYMP